MKQLPKDITIGEKYKPAMKITDQQEANEYFEICVQHAMLFGHSRQEAEKIERANLGYYAGYYNTETMERVERLFSAKHPLITRDMSQEEILQAGMDAAKKQK